MADEGKGPGVLSTADVGLYTIARTTLLDSRTTMAYAAAINDANPAYFDDLREGGLAVHPCISFSLQWASRFRPDQKLNLRAAPFGVHASTDLRIHRPFKAGEAITTQGRMIQKRQLRPGVYNVERYRMTASDGELVAELDYNGITRGATLEGADVVVAEEPVQVAFSAVSDEPLWHTDVPIALHAAQQYTECAQIYNPIHTEPSVARAAGLPDIILHGSATKAMSLTAIIDHYFEGDATRITRLCGQLRGMVLMNSVIRVEALAEEIVDSRKRILFRTLNAQGQPAISNGVVCGRLS
ncbi:MAG: MaoC/PaaZ C-terminal domain-containing protein [Pseudomonadales bacterium]|nr:MaoC family dehydratase N-terminal domain-containing protein [Pseudomonadales bacterium]